MNHLSSRNFAVLPLEEMEAELTNTLNPVRPDPFFVDQLGERLKRKPTILLEEKPFLGVYLVMASGLFFGAFLLWVLGYVFQILRKI